MPNLGWPEITLILVIVIVLFGWKRLPEISRSVGRSARIFKSEMGEMKKDGGSEASRATVPGETVSADVTGAAAREAADAERAAADAERAAVDARAKAAEARARAQAENPADVRNDPTL